MASEELSRRERRVLEAVIRSYVETAEPAGSRTLSQRCGLGVSPATIRNTMSDLEETMHFDPDDGIANLVDQSLVTRTGTRFSMLENVREYALELLAHSEDAETLAARHAAYFVRRPPAQVPHSAAGSGRRTHPSQVRRETPPGRSHGTLRQ